MLPSTQLGDSSVEALFEHLDPAYISTPAELHSQRLDGVQADREPQP